MAASTIKTDSATIVAMELHLDEVDQLLFRNYAEEELRYTPLQAQKLSSQQRITILGGFFRWVGGFFEPIWG